MGTNYYLRKKIDYINSVSTPETLGCGYDADLEVQELREGYVWNRSYYPNFEYLNKDFYQEIHIGKSSAGWHFSLCIYPEYDINNLEDWKRLFKEHKIFNEYKEEISAEEMIKIITQRGDKDYLKNYESLEQYQEDYIKKVNKLSGLYTKTYENYKELLRENHASMGLYDLWAHQEDKYTKRTDGTYDYIISGNDPEKGYIFS